MPIRSFEHNAVAKWFFLLALAGVTILFWKVLQPFVIVLITAGIAAVIVTPLEKHVRGWIGHPKLSAFIIVLLVLSAIVLPFTTITLLMADQAVGIVQDTVANPAWVNAFDVRSLPIVDSLPTVLVNRLAQIDLAQVMRSIADWAIQNVGTIFASSADVLFKAFIFFVSLYFFLVDREKIQDELRLLSPLRNSIDQNIMDRLVSTVRGVVFGSLIVAVIQGIIAAIGLTLFGVPGALIWAGLVVIAAQVPMLGTSVIMLPAVVYLFLSGHAPQAIGLLAWSVLAVGLIDNLLQPMIVGGRTRMHALLILLSMLGGLNAFGPIGFVLGPTILAAFLVMLDLYRSGILEKTKV
jgi:predicted PurR-regulated permease PerM